MAQLNQLIQGKQAEVDRCEAKLPGLRQTSQQRMRVRGAPPQPSSPQSPPPPSRTRRRRPPRIRPVRIRDAMTRGVLLLGRQASSRCSTRG